MKTLRSKAFWVPVIGIASCALCGFVSDAAPAGVASIPRLVLSADVIVIGTVTSARPPNPPSTGRLVLSVSDVLKGSYAGLLDLSYEVQSVVTEQAMIGKRVLAFGKLSGDGYSYTLLPMSYGPGALLRDQVLDVSAAVAAPALTIGRQDTPLQKVIKELGMTRLGSTTAAPYLMSLTSTRVEPDVTKAVFRAMQSSGPKNSALGAVGLVAMGDIDGLEAADSLDIQNHPELSSIISSIEGSYNDLSQAGLLILARWLVPSMPAVQRQAAAGALARIHTPGAVLQLGSALNDNDFEVRWRAVGGLAMFANNVPIGGVNPAPGAWRFRTADTIKFSAFDRRLAKKDEDTYLTFWRKWWNQNQQQIQALAASQTR